MNHPNPFVGKWTYRSFFNDPDLAKEFNDLELGRGTLVIDEAPPASLKGVIGGPGWSLRLKGARDYGSPMQIRFQGKGIVAGEEWIYDYVGFLSPEWPNGIQQRPALTGSIVRAIPHKSGSSGISPAGVVGSWFAVRQD